jgi:two-component system KDP operon response regulator KdpE
MTTLPLRILVVDDEPQIRRLLHTALGAHNYHVIEASNGESALVKASTEHPDAVVLDLGLPDIDGTDVIRRLREWSQVPIIILSVRGGERDKIQALDLGADDFVTKPFSMGELLARLRATLRHHLHAEADQPIFQNNGLVVDLSRRIVTVNELEVKLTPKEYDLLRQLVLHAGKVLTHRHLLREVWGPTFMGENHYVRVYIGTLRAKIERDPARPKYIITEPGVGYRMKG